MRRLALLIAVVSTALTAIVVATSPAAAAKATGLKPTPTTTVYTGDMWVDRSYEGYYVRANCSSGASGLMVFSTDTDRKYGVGTVTYALRGQLADSQVNDTDLAGEQAGGWSLPAGFFGTIRATVGRPGLDSFARTFELTSNGTCDFVAVTMP